MVKDLSTYGVIQGKSFVTNFLPKKSMWNIYLVDFIRGLFDGDGNVNFYKEPAEKIISSIAPDGEKGMFDK